MFSTRGSLSSFSEGSSSTKSLMARALMQNQAKEATRMIMNMAERIHTTPKTMENTSAILAIIGSFWGFFDELPCPSFFLGTFTKNFFHIHCDQIIETC